MNIDDPTARRKFRELSGDPEAQRLFLARHWQAKSAAAYAAKVYFRNDYLRCVKLNYTGYAPVVLRNYAEAEENARHCANMVRYFLRCYEGE